jgi:hypothetical protein
VTTGLGELEMELRLLPGVVNVGLGEPESGHVAVTLVTLGSESDLEETATRLARASHSAATVEILDLSPPRPPVHEALPLPGDERVALVTSTVDDAGEASVQLAWHGHIATASSTGGPLIGTARAVLGALQALGIGVEAVLASVSTGRGVPHSPVRVILRSELAGAEVVGIALASSASESAARAALAAFNRYVATHQNGR